MQKVTQKITEENYWELAMNFAQGLPKDERWVPIKLGSIEINEWARYFQSHLGWLPFGMRKLKDRSIQTMLVPTKNPWDFDPTFNPPLEPAPSWPQEKPYHYPDRASRDRVAAKAQEVRDHAAIAEPEVLVLPEAPQYRDVYERHQQTNGELSRATDRGIICPISWADKRWLKQVIGWKKPQPV